MKIAVDAMGGDHAPEAPVAGSLMAGARCPADLVLIGDEPRIEEILKRTGGASSVEVMHAPESIGMGESGSMAIRKKRDASLCVAMRLLAEGKVDAVVSAGNSSAIVSTAKYFVGLIPGLRRSAMAVPVPTRSGEVLLLDAGAYAEATTLHLAQSAALAHAYLKVASKMAKPRIGLLNIGREPSKGLKTIQRAFSILNRGSLNFIGNVEPHDIFADRTDAVVCDGFLGNVLLKTYEGLSETVIEFMEAQADDFEGPFRDKLRQTLQRFKKTCHYQDVGGAPLLGVQKTVVVAHGRSNAAAIASAIDLAVRLVQERISEGIAEELATDGILAELKHYNALLMLETLRNKWGFAPK